MHSEKRKDISEIPIRDDDGGSKYLWNYGKFLRNWKVQHRTTQSSSYSYPRSPQNSPEMLRIIGILLGVCDVIKDVSYIKYNKDMCFYENILGD